MLAAEQLTRLTHALAAGQDTPTDTLRALLLEVGGEECWQRPRLLHRLTLILHAQRPPMATSKHFRFKSAFAGKDFSGVPLDVDGKTKVVTAHNLSDEDVPLLKQYGYGHLLEPTSYKETDEAADLDRQIAELTARRAALTTPVAPAEVNSGILRTATETTETGTIIKHSSGGPDDLPIEAPAALQEQASVPDKIEVDEQPAAQPAPVQPAPTQPAPEAPAKKKH